MSNEYPYASMRDSFDLSAYFVVGPEDCKGRPLTDVVDQALHGGATFIQLRAKEADASELTDMARDIAQIIEDNEKSDSVAFVIDDRADVVWQARRKGIKAAPALNAATAGEAIRNKDFLRVAPILDYIRDNLSDPLTLDQIASQFYISKHYLCRIFKAATGFSVMEYIIYSRVLRARQLLQELLSHMWMPQKVW